jgi:signal peptide peptidase SppA
MKFQHICRYVRDNPWAITEDKLGDILDVLVARITGERFSDDEIKARVGESMNANAARIEAAAATSREQGRSVAVIPVLGTIFHRRAETMGESSGGTSTTMVQSMFRQALADQDVGTILIDTDSPGGTVAGVRELANEIFAAKGTKRIVALADTLMASAAYWIASQADEIIGTPSSLTGSIGVFTAHEDLSKRAELLGVKVTLISAGKFKTEGNPFEPLSDAAREQLQSRVDEAYSDFVKAVARGRGVKAADVRGGFGEGRVLPAKAALEAGLIDRISTRDEALSRLVGRRASSGMKAEIKDTVADLIEDAPIAAIDSDADLRYRIER